MYKKLLAAAFGLLALGVVAGTGNAAPLTGATNGLLAAKAETSNVIQVHGRHSSCRRDRFGWHRSPRHGVRTFCRPGKRWHRRHYHKHHHHHRHHRRHHHHH